MAAHYRLFCGDGIEIGELGALGSVWSGGCGPLLAAQVRSRVVGRVSRCVLPTYHSSTSFARVHQVADRGCQEFVYSRRVVRALWPAFRLKGGLGENMLYSRSARRRGFSDETRSVLLGWAKDACRECFSRRPPSAVLLFVCRVQASGACVVVSLGSTSRL